VAVRPSKDADDLLGVSLTLSGRGDASLSRRSPGYANYALSEFSEVVLLMRVCGLLFFFLDYLQAFDLLEGEAHYAAVLASVLEVDGLIVVADEDLRRNPAAVVEPL
jgi:hypothetical protein